MFRTFLKRARDRVPAGARNRIDLFTGRSALKRLGWFRSIDDGMCVDADGEPLPWYTYPAIAFLKDRIPADAKVFEFGMGNSTLWWASRAERVMACEGDRAWFERVAPQRPDKVKAVFIANESPEYPLAAAQIGERFDILVVDGRQRVACARESLPLLSERGVVIWDNADRSRYAAGFALLSSNGFRRLDFWGMGPLLPSQWLTSVFYRPDNILGI